MRFSPTDLPGVFLIELEMHVDERGSFARSFCVDEFAEAGIDFEVVQGNVSFTKFTGTVRGIHFQAPPHAEARVVRCTSGALFDVVVDLRRDSKAYGKWIGAELSADNRRAMYIPKGCAHGFQTLLDDTEVSYLMSERYVPEAAAGVRFDDPCIGIDWPLEVSSVSERDRNWPDFGSHAGATAP
jgi:dTDP-4-dehydrorhamnose 3,5-epimerase